MRFASPLFLSSGDLIADRRYGYARDLIADGDHAAASDLLLQALERVPGFASAWFALGELCEILDDPEGAVEAFRQALETDPDDRHGAALRLERLGVTLPGPAMSPAYVRTLFDQYAPRFDKALTEDLAYQGPNLIFDAVFETCAAIGRECWFDRALDLGCGTGLVGRAFAKRIGALHGVDLSPQMAVMARRRGYYIDVHVGEMHDYLRGQGDNSADLMLAVDCLIYRDDLGSLFVEASRVLDQHGLFAFTAETHDGEGAVLGEKLRYAHAPRYLRESLAGAGLVPILFEAVSCRVEADIPVPGLLVVAQQPFQPTSPIYDEGLDRADNPD